jgi:hypothetical protein
MINGIVLEHAQPRQPRSALQTLDRQCPMTPSHRPCSLLCGRFVFLIQQVYHTHHMARRGLVSITTLETPTATAVHLNRELLSPLTLTLHPHLPHTCLHMVDPLQ